jgi:hypothetical protein
MGCCACVGGAMRRCVGPGLMETGETGGGKSEMAGEWPGLSDPMPEGRDGWLRGWETMPMTWFRVGS